MYINKHGEADLNRLRKLESTGHILTTDGLRFICSAHDYDPERIGKYFLEKLAEWNAETASL